MSKNNSICKQCGYFYCNCYTDDRMDAWKRILIKKKEEQHRKIKFKIKDIEEIKEEDK